MSFLFVTTVAVLAVVPPAPAPETTKVQAQICRENRPAMITTAIAEIQDKAFYKKWLESKRASQPDFDPQNYLFDRLSQIDTMVACESIAFGIQRSIYQFPNANEKEIVDHVNLQDALTYQLMRVVSTDIYSETVLGHVKASKEESEYTETGDRLAAILASFQEALDQKLQKAKLVYKDVGVYNLEGANLQTIYDESLAKLQQVENRGGTVTVYFNFISPPDVQKLGKVRHSILAEISPPHFYLFDMNAPNWIVTWGSGDGKYANTEMLLKNALDDIRIVYLQPNVGNMETALQLVVYSDAD